MCGCEHNFTCARCKPFLEDEPRDHDDVEREQEREDWLSGLGASMRIGVHRGHGRPWE